MSHRLFVHTVTASLLAAVMMSSGCGAGTPGPSSPSPTAPAALNPPSVSAVSPATGSTGGGTIVTITGSGFQPGATVTLGVERQTTRVDQSTVIQVTTSAQNAGAVEITVTNPDGQSVRRSGGYTYASPQSFDFNGAWVGYALAHPDSQATSAPHHSDMPMLFTIENNVLTSVTCAGVVLAFSVPPVVKDGAFSYSGDGGVVLTGRIVADGDSVGTIDTDMCPATRWNALKR
jgi:hypothetical protein